MSFKELKTIMQKNHKFSGVKNIPLTHWFLFTHVKWAKNIHAYLIKLLAGIKGKVDIRIRIYSEPQNKSLHKLFNNYK